MSGELRALHDRLGATTVFVTHDQIEAMSMADTIAVMNNGMVEQLGSPQEIYDRPANMFVANFIGSPPMNFIDFHGQVRAGDRSVHIGDAELSVPQAREAAPDSHLVLGARPEHVRLSASAPLRASVVDAEYLGTTQIVTLTTERGGTLKARMSAETKVRPGDRTGLEFRSEKLLLFDRVSGRALRSALHEGASHG
jgi:multiple sugar transport system ATP-binding protein